MREPILPRTLKPPHESPHPRRHRRYSRLAWRNLGGLPRPHPLSSASPPSSASGNSTAWRRLGALPHICPTAYSGPSFSSSTPSLPPTMAISFPLPHCRRTSSSASSSSCFAETAETFQNCLHTALGPSIRRLPPISRAAAPRGRRRTGGRAGLAALRPVHHLRRRHRCFLRRQVTGPPQNGAQQSALARPGRASCRRPRIRRCRSLRRPYGAARSAHVYSSMPDYPWVFCSAPSQRSATWPSPT